MHLRNVVTAVALFAAIACEAGSATLPSASELAKITVTGTSAVLNIGQTTQLTAAGFTAADAPVALPSAPVWTSAPTSVATVDNSGKVTAVSGGTAIITATLGTVKGTFNIRVALTGGA